VARRTAFIEGWFAPFALVNGSAVGLVPILLPVVSVKYGVGHVGLVMGAVPLAAILVSDKTRPLPPAMAPQAATVPAPAAAPAHMGLVGEWGPASPTRVQHLQHRRRPFTGFDKVLGGGFGWMLAAWVPAYAGSAIVFSLYPVLFSHSFGVQAQTSALAFAVIVFVSLPLFIVAGHIGQRRGPVRSIIGGMGARVVLLGVLAGLAAAGHVPYVLPMAAFAGILFAWSFLSVASPALTAQLVPDAEGDAQGMLNASSGMAGLVGSVAGGEVANAWGYPAG
jgi:hypothetical protein